MEQDLYRIEEVYKTQLLNEGIIWDGVKWVWRKIKDSFKNPKPLPTADRTEKDIPQPEPKQSRPLGYLKIEKVDNKDNAVKKTYGQEVFRANDNAETMQTFNSLAESPRVAWYRLLEDGNLMGLAAVASYTAWQKDMEIFVIDGRMTDEEKKAFTAKVENEG